VVFKEPILLRPLSDLYCDSGRDVLGIPTLAQMEELCNLCDLLPIWQKDTLFYRAVSRCNGEEIVLPATGWIDEINQKTLSYLVKKVHNPPRTDTEGREREKKIRLWDFHNRIAADRIGRYLTRTTDTRWSPIGWRGGVHILEFNNEFIGFRTIPRDMWIGFRPVLNRFL
jgi:hypothetical protein